MSQVKEKAVKLSRGTLIRGWLLTAVAAFALGASTNCQMQAQEDPLGMSNRKFTREETMLLNMLHSKGSVGYLILESVRLSKESTRSLEKALFRLREIEKSYAKSKGQPDTRYLATTELKMVQAKQHSEELEGFTSDCFHVLKSSIKETLLDASLKGEGKAGKVTAK
ncbi:MAG: hypothetical protein KGS72_15620 [Cyanobacteria bacterium REEB67]|nr:hypothetical protein [Cyanobacteria bacterium REEB67]